MDGPGRGGLTVSRSAGLSTTRVHSESEVDPHAFLFRPKTVLVLIPDPGYSEVERGAGREHRWSQHLRTWSGGPGPAHSALAGYGDTLWTAPKPGLGPTMWRRLTDEGWIPFSLAG
jgi:hypothetical protein